MRVTLPVRGNPPLLVNHTKPFLYTAPDALASPLSISCEIPFCVAPFGNDLKLFVTVKNPCPGNDPPAIGLHVGDEVAPVSIDILMSAVPEFVAYAPDSMNHSVSLGS